MLIPRHVSFQSVLYIKERKRDDTFADTIVTIELQKRVYFSVQFINIFIHIKKYDVY